MLTLVFLLMLLLFLVTGFLTGAYRRERNVRAALQFNAGENLARRGHYDEAIDHYTEALVLARGRTPYILAFARALVSANRTREAETYLMEVIEHDPASGIANLMLARINAQREDLDSTVRHYQRAIYGLWPQSPSEQRINVRFELIDLLLQQRRYSQLEAELLRQKDDLPDDAELQKRLGRLFLTARAPEEARDVFAGVVQKSPRDAAAWAGLGDAQFQLRQYLLATNPYRQALRYNPNDLQSRTQLELSNEVVGLNPMLRGLTATRRLERSRKLIGRTLAEYEACISDRLDVLPESFQTDVALARQARTGDTVEENVDLAERLHETGKLTCGSPAAPDRALELVLEKLLD